MHNTVQVWSFVPKFSAYEETKGTYLEAVEEFTLAAGVRADPHYHDTHEFFYILEDSAILQIENKPRVCRVGDFIRIRRRAVHTGKALENGVRAFAFSVSYQEPMGSVTSCGTARSRTERAVKLPCQLTGSNL
jgi:quercetin dioxygenase-like cupin family protein